MNRALLVAVALATLVSSAAAQSVLKREPPHGSQVPFSSAYIDDGKCPRGKIKLVAFGSVKHRVKRQRQCVDRPPGL